MFYVNECLKTKPEGQCHSESKALRPLQWGYMVNFQLQQFMEMTSQQLPSSAHYKLPHILSSHVIIAAFMLVIVTAIPNLTCWQQKCEKLALVTPTSFFPPFDLQVKIKLLLSKYQIRLLRKLQSPTVRTNSCFYPDLSCRWSTNHFQFQAPGALQVVGLSFPNFANSFQKYYNFYTTQQNVSHPFPLFLTPF